MDKAEMRDLVLRLFQKERRIWELMASEGNETAKGHLEKVVEAEALFREGFHDDE